ncbi:hypothetical protein YT1_2587 [Rhodococcus ruber]|nr:hypothetical protein YT1_2587 [Rhodococcus ruber]
MMNPCASPDRRILVDLCRPRRRTVAGPTLPLNSSNRAY